MRAQLFSLPTSHGSAGVSTYVCESSWSSEKLTFYSFDKVFFNSQVKNFLYGNRRFLFKNRPYMCYNNN